MQVGLILHDRTFGALLVHFSITKKLANEKSGCIRGRIRNYEVLGRYATTTAHWLHLLQGKKYNIDY